jgi:hypothetical protein
VVLTFFSLGQNGRRLIAGILAHTRWAIGNTVGPFLAGLALGLEAFSDYGTRCAHVVIEDVLVLDLASDDNLESDSPTL